MSIISLYESILNYSGLKSDRDGMISTSNIYTDDTDPVTIDGRRLILPTPENLRIVDYQNVIKFHPLSENILRGESEVIAKLTECINIRLNYTIGIIATRLLEIIANPELHKTLTPDQTNLVIMIPEMDKTAVENFMKILLHGVKGEGTTFFMNLFLKRGGMIDGKKYFRSGYITFKLYHTLSSLDDSNECRVAGVNIRRKDVNIFKSILEFIIPNIATPTYYSYGSMSDVAPYLDALMNTSIRLASQLNDVIDIFRDHIPEADDLMFDANWVDQFKDLNDLVPEIRRIPPQDGNEGRARINEPTQSVPVPTSAMAPQPALPVPQMQQPVQQVQQAMPLPASVPSAQVAVTENGADIASLEAQARQRNMAMYQQPMMQQMPAYMQQAPQMPMQQGMMPQQMMPQMPMQSMYQPPMMQQPMQNAGWAVNSMVGAQMPMQQNMMPGNRVPGFAMPDQPMYYQQPYGYGR